MTFGAEVAASTAKIKGLTDDCFEDSVHAVKESIVEGSPVTGAPGQPVAEGGDAKLKESWTEEIAGERGVVSTPVEYAPDVENATRHGKAMHLQSKTGGFHSVKLTIAGFQLLVADVVRKRKRS